MKEDFANHFKQALILFSLLYLGVESQLFDETVTTVNFDIPYIEDNISPSYSWYGQ